MMNKSVSLLIISFIIFPLISLSQLVSGDIAFIGYNTDGTDNFSFITLNSVPGSQVIYLTEEGWDNATGTWVGTTEGHITYTAPAAGLPCGTVVSINETGPSTFTVSGGGTAVLGSGSGWSLSGGDQVLAYLAATPEPASTPTFIAGVHGDDGNGAPITLDPATGWNDSDLLSPLGTARSEVPPGLTNGTDCVSLFPTVGTEQDNAKYTGTLTGTSTAIRASINDRTNWSSNNSTPFAIQPADYSPSVTCVAPCSDPIMFAVSAAPTNVCDGENSTLTIQGVLNDATHWAVYTGSCGGTLLGTTATPSFVVTPGLPSTTYFVRGEGGCVTPGTCMSTTVNVTPIDDPSFTYPSASFCQNSSDPTPTITGDPGGTFSSAPAGLSINSSTGEIDVSASTPNSYTVTYTTAGACPESSDVAVLINATDDASFAFSTTTFCQSGTDPTPTITGLAGGTFSSAPAGLSINSSTGEIDLSSSTPNNYTITYTTAGTCPNSSNVSITINPLDDASFAFSTTTFCQNGTDPTPSITGLAGGTFSSAPAGLSINSSTGGIDLSSSTPSNYTVTYTTAGSCPNSSNVSITINPLDDASFVFSTTTFCQNGTDPTPSITGLGGGTFSSAPAGLSMNTSTGEIDLSASTANNYTITYTTAGSCPNSSDVSITINPLDDASFAFSTTTFCQNGTDPTPSITGLAGGTFSSAPAGLSINASTGEIDLSASTPSNYTVMYTTAGSCPNSSDVSITINPLDDASFAFSTTTFCQNGTDPTPSITGLAGGTFSSAPAGLSMNTSTGEIDLSASTANNYTITYTTAGSCPNSSDVSITINALDDASFAFSTTTFCQSGTDPTPSITGLAGGTFSSIPAGLSINASTGEIDLSASTANNYTVTYTTAGPCANSSNVSISINPLDDASFAFSTTTFCQSGTDPTPSITGLAGGTFSSTPAGLSMNASTGEIDLSASTPNNYTVTYTTAGSCLNSSNVSITINTLDDAAFAFSTTTFCQNGTDPTPSITGLAGGTFSSAPAGLSINASTGEIDLSASTANNYTVTYTTTGSCPNSSDVSITVNGVDVTVNQTFDTLTANATGLSYQWLNCSDDYSVVSGETNQQFIATTNGTYAVEISELGCVDTSECFIVNNLSITENETMISRVYPNPTSGKINIEFANKINQGTITIRNITGQLIVEETIQGINAHSLSLNKPSGIYFIEVSLEKEHKEVFKFILK